MKKVGNHNSISRILLLSLAVMLTFSAKSFSQEGDAAAGKALFNANCAACHKLDAKMTGPALRGVTERHTSEWLHTWIKDSQAMIKSGDAAAVKLFEDNNKAIMPPYPQLSAEDVDNILAYTAEPLPAPTVAAPGAAAQGGGADSGSGVSNAVILGALALVMGILVVMLFLVSSVLKKIVKANGIEAIHKEPTMPIWKAYAKNQFLVLVTVILLMLSGAWVVYGYLMQIGVDQNYAPIQPIHYSHKIHAGENGIDCKYCHSAARTSKNAGIPSLNVCMNCHKSIAEFSGDPDSTYVEYSKEFYTAEIQKLYDAVGWDKDNQKYTGKTKPVKWVRIHNLPDFVYFNHSQHVDVAGLECQKCHGPVENYEIMKQFAPLTMGWCINCHRETNVKMEGNEYYEKIHAELAKKYGKDKLTAAEMGGLECGKCHY
ncbi:cytochrome c3 family protein [Flavobacterium antarcticum]|uniref:cytochrome c3 family protein n=1 Tax=Flavobacterium antarcticum TaxID=271155 RepID=UPI0003B420D2|nr:cytochrome c3 family protein [Flavobacterium antarcticum]